MSVNEIASGKTVVLTLILLGVDWGKACSLSYKERREGEGHVC